MWLVQVSKMANVVLADAATCDRLSNREVYTRLIWVGGRVHLEPTALLFRANRLNQIANRSAGVPEICLEFGVSLDMIDDLRVRSWLGFKAVFIRPTNSGLVMGIRCWGAEDFAAQINAQCVR